MTIEWLFISIDYYFGCQCIGLWQIVMRAYADYCSNMSYFPSYGRQKIKSCSAASIAEASKVRGQNNDYGFYYG